MHLPLHRRNTKRAGSPPKAAPCPPETSGTSGAIDSLPHDTQSTKSTQSQNSPPHGLKGLGKRMTSFSKPVRMLKSMASRSSLRHNRIPSAASVRSTGSQHEAASVREHERDVKEGRASVDTDYGNEVTGTGQSDAAPVPAGDKRKAVEGVIEHEAVARQEPSTEAPAPEQAEEARERVEQAANALEEHAALTVDAAVAPVATDAEDVKDIAIDAEQARDPKEAGSGDQLITESLTESISESVVLVEPVSLSSSTTAVEPPLQLAAVDDVKSNGDSSKEIKEIKMQGESADVDPFLVDDPEDPLSDPESQKEAASSPAAKSDAGTPTVHSIILSKELENADRAAPLPPVPAPVADEKQSAPPPPEKPMSTTTGSSSSPMSSSTEDEAPELHAPALTVTSLFLPVPQTDPLSTLLTKYVPEPHTRPPRDTVGEWQHTDFHTLVMTNNWRALARMTRDRIVTTNPRDVELILNLWYIRLSSLARLRLFNQTSAECENLFGVLATIEPQTSRSYILRNVLPFELEVLRARCAYWSGDHFGYLDDVSALLHRCRVRARQTRDPAGHAMWKERGARMALIVASQLVEMKDYTAAASLLEPLCMTGVSPPSPALRSAIARIYLQGGNLTAAAAHFGAVDADPHAEPALKSMNDVIRAAAEGDWVKAAGCARKLVEGEAGDVVAANNYAVALLGQGRVKEGIQVLEASLQASPSATTTTEPYLFNLSTMYELRAGLTTHRKRDLLIEVAKWSGDGLRTACLKMNP